MKAVIFDMDGVVSDTQKLQVQVESELLKKYGIEMTTDELTETYAGVSDREWLKKLSEEYGVFIDIDKTLEEKWEKLFLLVKDGIDAMPGVIEFIDKLRTSGFKLAIASASPVNFIEFVLSKLNLKDKFDVITSSTEVEHGKPSPDVFLLAAKRLGLKPEECIVIEDGVNGMVAAKRANMFCIGYVNRKVNKDLPADIIISNFNEINIEELK
ncbi:MAG: HAD family phosphatase [Candidatus Woesearchaeota archaeon]|nr:MAG: HAD family phosphatase [Candidatus Woesearchaeota archaeon]